MTQEEKQLLLKDLSARLPYELKVQYKEKTYDLPGLDKGRIFVNIARIGEWLPTVYTFDIKPYLRPMSSMTEEESNEYLNIDNRSYSCPMDYAHIPASDRIDWLLKNYFDFRWLIPMGLAIEVTEEDNPYK